MPTLLRVRTQWSGFSGGPGYTNFHFRDFFGSGETGVDPTADDAQAATEKTFRFWDAIQNLFPTAVRLDVDPEVDVIDIPTGDLVDSFSTIAQFPVAGDAAGPYSAAAGAVVNWRTNGIRNSRRVRGKTFLVPLSSGAYGNDGQLTPVTRGTILTAATALSTDSGSPDLGVYARPSSSTAEDGAWFVARSTSVPSMSAILTSRRD